ncbi:MAG: hypothetical protein AAF984_11140 [Verrucomicrobiota bacterium]
MQEGWLGNEYIVLFEEDEISQKSVAYNVEQLLPGHRILGLISWDDFLVVDQATEQVYRVPTIPASLMNRKIWTADIKTDEFCHDQRYTGKVKWHVRPTALGGNPESSKNLVWISHDEHPELVKYWNEMHSSPHFKSDSSIEKNVDSEILTTN